MKTRRDFRLITHPPPTGFYHFSNERFGNEGLLKIFSQSMTHLLIELMNEIDKVAPVITDPPLTSFTTLSTKKCNMGHMTCDM